MGGILLIMANFNVRLLEEGEVQMFMYATIDSK